MASFIISRRAVVKTTIELLVVTASQSRPLWPDVVLAVVWGECTPYLAAEAACQALNRLVAGFCQVHLLVKIAPVAVQMGRAYLISTISACDPALELQKTFCIMSS
jgi:hypothetical protein